MSLGGGCAHVDTLFSKVLGHFKLAQVCKTLKHGNMGLFFRGERLEGGHEWVTREPFGCVSLVSARSEGDLEALGTREHGLHLALGQRGRGEETSIPKGRQYPSLGWGLETQAPGSLCVSMQAIRGWFVSPQIYMLKPSPLVLQNVTVLGDGVFNEVITWKWGQWGGPSSNMTGILLKGG